MYLCKRTALPDSLPWHPTVRPCGELGSFAFGRLDERCDELGLVAIYDSTRGVNIAVSPSNSLASPSPLRLVILKLLLMPSGFIGAVVELGAALIVEQRYGAPCDGRYCPLSTH
jgi:hypothetical protein